ncbi:MAG: hypothetical protein IPG47_16730 [Thermoflexaceae bacterium]|nr:hypothetical protein [Thermoflexaceae bacterium]
MRIGMPEGVRAPVAAALAARHAGPTLLLVANPARAGAVAEELGLFLAGIPLARLPERERLPYEFARDDPLIAVERARALSLLRGDVPALVVASWAAIAERTAGPEVEAAGVDIRTGEAHPPAALMAALEASGYLVAHLADRPGTATRRGGIIDIFPAGDDQAYRIEFFGDDVESIRVLDVATQRSVKRMTSVHVPPAATGTHQARGAAAELLRALDANGDGAELVMEQLEILAGGGRSDYEGFFEPLLYSGDALDHLSGAVQVVIEDQEEGENALRTLLEHQRRTRTELERRGAIPEGLPEISGGAEHVAAAIEQAPLVVHIQRFGVDELGAKRLPITATPSFAGRLRALVQQADAWAKQGRAVVVASQQALRLVELADADGLTGDLRRALTEAPREGTVTFVPVAVGGGFTLDERLVFVTDAEIFGFRKRRKPTRTRQGVRPDIVSTLEVGDYLVHADHGIARYGGLIRRAWTASSAST